MACSGPETSSNSGDFWKTGLPQQYNKLSEEKEKKAHELVSMAEDVLYSLNENTIAGYLSMKNYFKAGNYEKQNFRNDIRSLCLFESLQESNRDKTVEYKWTDSAQKSTRGLNKERGEELISCPIELSGTQTNFSSTTTQALENVTLSSSQLNYALKPLKEEDTRKSTIKKVAYLTRTLTPVTDISVTTSSETVVKLMKDHRHPGKSVEKSTLLVELVYLEGETVKRAKIRVLTRRNMTKKMTSRTTSLDFGRVVTALVIEMEDGTASVEQSTTYKGDLDTDSYTKVNGKTIIENGKPVAL